MNIFDSFLNNINNSLNLIPVKFEENKLIFKEQIVNILCEQVEAKIENIISLIPDEKEGLIATIKHKNMIVELHFTPEFITLKEEVIEGELRLLKKPNIASDSWFYKTLIGGWKIFLGGNINNLKYENITVKKDKIYYTLPRNELKILNFFFDNVENNSRLITTLKEKELTIESELKLKEINFDWSEIMSIFSFNN
jgi:hypothetical protein